MLNCLWRQAGPFFLPGPYNGKAFLSLNCPTNVVWLVSQRWVSSASALNKKTALTLIPQKEAIFSQSPTPTEMYHFVSSLHNGPQACTEKLLWKVILLQGRLVDVSVESISGKKSIFSWATKNDFIRNSYQYENAHHLPVQVIFQNPQWGFVTYCISSINSSTNERNASQKPRSTINFNTGNKRVGMHFDHLIT